MTRCYLCSAEPADVRHGPDGRLRPVCQDHIGTTNDTWDTFRRAGPDANDDEDDEEEIAPTEEEQG